MDAARTSRDKPPAPPAEDLAARLDERYRAPLMTYFLRRVRDRAEAEDLTQEVFLRILRRGDPAPLDNAEVFLFSIAGNLLRDRARRAEARRARDHQSLDAPEADFREAGRLAGALVEARVPERVLMSQEQLGEVLSALTELGERTRDIFILYRLEKMKHREIGALYGLSANAVEKYVRKATAHLARRFGR